MPFKIITTVVHEGWPDPEEYLVVNKTNGKLKVAARRTDSGKRYFIPWGPWPKAVQDAVNEIANELRHSGKIVIPGPSDFTAWIDSRRGLVEGQKVHVFVTCDRFARNKTVILRGTITGFTIP